MSDVAVVLSGCGVFDGTEIHEISAVCAALSRAGKNIGREEINTVIINVSLKLQKMLRFRTGKTFFILID